MDSTAGDLNHGVQEVSLNIERQLSHQSSHHTLRSTKSHQTMHTTQSSIPPVPPLNQDPEKPYPAPLAHSSSSGSSSDDVVKMEKLDSKIVKIKDVKDGEEAWAHLPPHEQEIIKRQLEIPEVKVNYRTLYRYATRNDMIIVVVSTICAIAGGAVMPLMTVRESPLGSEARQKANRFRSSLGISRACSRGSFSARSPAQSSAPNCRTTRCFSCTSRLASSSPSTSARWGIYTPESTLRRRSESNT